jgi:glutamate--cysteine ligase
MTGAAPAPASGVASRNRVAQLRDFVRRQVFATPSRSATERIGAEIEFVAVDDFHGRVAPLDAPDGQSVLGAVRAASARCGWTEGRSTKGASWFRATSGGRVTFEPGGQIEYASPPRSSATDLIRDLSTTTAILREECSNRGIRLLDCGLDPANGPHDAPLQVSAPRYRRMDAHFARIGPAGARMMRQTASLQIAIDLGRDSGRRWRLLNALVPVLTAVFANSRRYAGSDTGFASYRAETWRRADPSRTGVLDGIDPVSEYVDFALRAPALLLGPESDPAQPFATWVGRGAGVAQWENHLGTLFPEVRPRGYFEVRSIDAVPESRWPAALVLIAGLAYDRVAADEAAEIIREPDAELLERAGRFGLTDPVLAGMARQLATVALAGCRRLGPAFLSDEHRGAAEDFFATLTG